ncbi:MAG TPA: hypothetical protein PLD30_15635 [Candidatus Competibacteraceae bacterium]|nr:hypothetical protein [Candidatus Competibacteraceae bacterium]
MTQLKIHHPQCPISASNRSSLNSGGFLAVGKTPLFKVSLRLSRLTASVFV